MSVVARGRGGVAAGDDQLLQGPDLAGFHPGADLGEVGVEAAVEAEHDGHGVAADLFLAGPDGVDVQVDGLLAQHGQPVGGRTGDEVDVGGGGRADDDPVEAWLGEDLCGVLHGPRAGLRRQTLGGVDEGVGDQDQVEVGVGGHVAGVDLPDPPGAEQSQAKASVVGHGVSFRQGKSGGGFGDTDCRGSRPARAVSLSGCGERGAARVGPGQIFWRAWEKELKAVSWA